MDYKRARDLSWEILIRNKVSSLPVDVEAICIKEGITLLSYETGRELIENLDLPEHTLDNDAFSVGNIICFDENSSPQRRRFSIAHELGHIFLHTGDGNKVTLYNREPQPLDDPIENEANLFASRLLAPLGVIQFLNLNTISEISQYCDISYSAAKLRYHRLCEIRKRSSKRLKEKKHGTFLLSRLERQVIENFKEYIEKNKK